MKESMIKFPTERLARYQKEEAELAYQIEKLENELECLDRKRESYRIRIEEIEKLRYPEEHAIDMFPKEIQKDIANSIYEKALKQGWDDLIAGKTSPMRTASENQISTSEFNKSYAEKVTKEINPNTIKEAVKKFEDRKTAQELNSDMDTYIDMLIDADMDAYAEVVGHKKIELPADPFQGK